MKGHPDPVLVVDEEGAVRIPAAHLSRLGFMPGARVRVRLAGDRLTSALARKGSTPEQAARIAARQLEEEERVVRFLLVEGSLHATPQGQLRARKAR